jgi:hypothetical protein
MAKSIMMKKPALALLFVATALSGCSRLSLEGRHDKAVDIAAHAGMTERVIRAGVFNITAFERVTKADAPADVYIEGDGLAWLSAHTKSLNPTPPDPTALHLAAEDTAANVIYLARPCQYSGWVGNGGCPDTYWTDGRTAPEVVGAYMVALNDIKLAHHLSGFNLIGYSGGAGVATLAAAGRQDVLSLRTVAGNTDYAVFTQIHHISPMTASIDPITAAAQLAHIPQLHFIGANDTVVPQVIFDSWRQAAGTSTCIRAATVPDATHEKGWTAPWPALLAMPVSCAP